MPPRLSLAAATRALTIRTRPSIIAHAPLNLHTCRAFARTSISRTGTSTTNGNGNANANANKDELLLGVSEEAAKESEILGEVVPDLGMGTKVQDILKDDTEALQNAPKIIKEDIQRDANRDKKASTPESAASETNAPAAETAEVEGVTFENLLALGQLEAVADGKHASEFDVSSVGHKFGLPSLPLPSDSHLKYRYDPVVSQVTNLLMKDGKLSRAQRNMSYILNHLRTAPTPTVSPSHPLLPGSPPAAQLPLNPVLYLTLAIDSLAPLLRIRQLKGAAGGGAALPMPQPLALRQRRRTAIMWIIDAAAKKQSRGSGRGQFAQRVAEEVVSVLEGKSGAWEKRLMVHKAATSARANLNHKKFGKR